MAPEPPLLTMSGITKSFPGVRALDGVDLDVQAGEVHCLLGQNGAGKSTLIKVLSGAHQPDDGTITWRGAHVTLKSPIAAMRLGIATIYQELDLVEGLSVAENVHLGHEPTAAGFVVRGKAARASTAALLKRLGHPEIDPARLVGELSAAQQQIVSMARALSHDVRLIVMDEPSAALDPDEVDNLFRIVGDLTSDGVAVVYISHRLEEIRRIGDRVTVLKDGRAVAGGLPAKSTPTREVVALMTGRNVEYVFPDRPRSQPPGEPVLRVQGLAREGEFAPLDLDLRPGEIVGLAGLVGSGRSEILETIYGARIQRGGGYVGIHAAADTEYDWPFYGGLVGAYFQSHPAIQPATVDVEDRAHPATSGLPKAWDRTDEWYNYCSNPRDRAHVLASLDESSYTGGTMSGDHPIAWCQEYRGGRAFYTGGGHTKESYSELALRKHLLGGIRYAIGDTQADCRPENGYRPLFDGTAASLAAWKQAGPGSFSLSDDGTLTSQGDGHLLGARGPVQVPHLHGPRRLHPGERLRSRGARRPQQQALPPVPRQGRHRQHHERHGVRHGAVRHRRHRLHHVLLARRRPELPQPDGRAGQRPERHGSRPVAEAREDRLRQPRGSPQEESLNLTMHQAALPPTHRVGRAA